jgi:acyl-CoA reductase-like NAD-dependent aldehyde dehydrogenase
VRVANFAEALDLVNAHEFGNGVACFTSDGNIAREFARRVQVGMVALTYRFRYRWLGMALVAGSAPYSVT